MKIKIGELYEIYQKYGDLDFKVNTPYGYKNIEWCGITEKNADVYRCELENGMFVEGADYHRLKNTNNEFVHLKEIQIGEKVQTKNGDSTVVSIELLKEKDTLYDVQVEEVHQYYTNGIVSHNTVLTVDLLMFLFFNTTTKTSKAEEVFNRFSDKNRVSVRGDIMIDGEEYLIVRNLDRKLSKSGEWNVKTELDFFKKLADGQLQNFTGEQRRETESFIKNSIGDIDDFLMTILTTASNLEDLLEAKPTARGQVLSRFLGLEFLKKKEETGKELYSEFNKSMMSNVYNTETLKSDIEGLNTRIENYKIENNDLDDKILDADVRLTKGREYKEGLISQKYNDIDHELLILNSVKLESEISTLKGKINTTKLQIKEVDVVEPSKYFKEDEYDKIKESYNDNYKQKTVVDVKINELVQLSKTVSGGIKCEHCGIDLMNAVLTQAKLSEMDTLKEQGKNLGDVLDELNTKEKEYLQIKKEFVQYEKSKLIKEKYELILEADGLKLDNVEGKLERYHQVQTKIEKNKSIEEQIIKANLRIEEIEREKTSHTSKISSNKTMIQNCERDIKNKQDIITQIASEFEKEKIYKTYLEIFGKNGISKMIMKTMTPLINDELQRLLQDSAFFKLEVRINDKNEVEFVMIDNGTGVEKLMASGSGFERTIASLALRAVLSKVCSLPKPNIVVFDEVFGKVSNENLDMVGEFFTKIKDYFEKVFVITHNPLVSNWSDNVVKIKKEDNISKVIQ